MAKRREGHEGELGAECVGQRPAVPRDDEVVNLGLRHLSGVAQQLEALRR